MRHTQLVPRISKPKHCCSQQTNAGKSETHIQKPEKDTTKETRLPLRTYYTPRRQARKDCSSGSKATPMGASREKRLGASARIFTKGTWFGKPRSATRRATKNMSNIKTARLRRGGKEGRLTRSLKLRNSTDSPQTNTYPIG